MKPAKKVGTALFVALLLALSACSNEGPAERAGQEVDKAVAQAGEKLGQATDAAGEKLEQAGHALKDAARGDKQ